MSDAIQQVRPEAAAIDKPRTVQSVLMSKGTRNAIQRVLPKHLDVDRILQVSYMAWLRQPKLRDCEPMQVVSEVIKAAELGLEPSGGVMGHGDLIPTYNPKTRKTECQFRPRYGGLIQLARNTREIKSIFAEVVLDGEPFRCWNDETGQHISHEPDWSRDRDVEEDVTLAYAVAILTSGEVQMSVMPKASLERARAVSETEKAKRAGKFDAPTAWETWYGEMAKKTVIKRLCKNLPKSTQLAKAIEADNRDVEIDEPLMLPEPIHATVSVDDVSPSDEPNRGHDETQPVGKNTEPAPPPPATQAEMDQMFPPNPLYAGDAETQESPRKGRR